MRTENFPKLKRSDHSPKRDEFIDVSSDPPYFSLDSPFKVKVDISFVVGCTFIELPKIICLLKVLG